MFQQSYQKNQQNTTHKVTSTMQLWNVGILLEMNSDEGADWLRQEDIGEKLTDKIKDSQIKGQSFNVIAHFIPLTFNPDNPEHLREVEQTNSFMEKTIVKEKWAKPPQQQSPSQTNGHLIVSFADPNTANQAILKGMVVCHKCASVLKCKYEPLWCLKCHGWNHIATACKEMDNTCGTCGGGHRNTDCNSGNTHFCTPCGMIGHTSWDRRCPTFMRKCSELNKKYPDNSLLFCPSKDLWMWVSELLKNVPAPSFLNMAPCNKPPTQSSKSHQTALPFAYQQTAPNGHPLECQSWDHPKPNMDPQTSSSAQTKRCNPPHSTSPHPLLGVLPFSFSQNITRNCPPQSPHSSPINFYD